MKMATDAIRNIGQPVEASSMLLNLLRGDNPRFSTAFDITAGNSGMTFSTTLDQLKLKVPRLENEAKLEAANTFIASPSSSSSCSGSDCCYLVSTEAPSADAVAVVATTATGQRWWPVVAQEELR